MPTSSPRLAGHMLNGLLRDLAPSLITYYALHAVGVDDWKALLGAAVVSGLLTAWSAVRHRRFNAFATLTLVIFGVGFLLAFVGHDPRLVILKDSALTGTIGLLFLVSTAFGRPFTMEAMKSWKPDEAAAIDHAWATDPAARHGYRLNALVWGGGMLGEALLRIVLVFVLPVDVMVGLSSVMWITLVVVLVGWTQWHAARVEKREAARDAAAGNPATEPVTDTARTERIAT